MPGTPLNEKNSAYERWRWQVLFITWLAYVGFYLTRKSFPIAKIELAKPEVLGWTKADMAWVDGVFGVTYILGNFFWGALGDRFGPRKVVTAGLFASVLMALAMGASSSVVVIGLLFGLQGLCQSTGWGPLTKNIGEFFSLRERGWVLGLWCTNMPVGDFVAAAVASTAAEHLGWRFALWVPAGCLLGITFLFLRFQRNRPEDVGLPSIERYHGEEEAVLVATETGLVQTGVTSWGRLPTCRRENARPVGNLPHVGQAAGPARPMAGPAACPTWRVPKRPPGEPGPETLAEEPEGSWKVVAEVLRNQMVWLLALAYLLIKPTRYLLMFWAPLYVNERLGAGVVESSLLGSMADLAGLISPFLGGWVSDRLFRARRMPVSVLALVGCAAMWCLFGLLPPTRLALGLGLFAIGFLIYIPETLLSGSAAIDFGTRRGASTASGLINGSGSVGGLIGLTIPGWIAQVAGPGSDTWNPIFTGLGLGLALAALLLVPQWNRLPATSARAIKVAPEAVREDGRPQDPASIGGDTV